MPVFSCFPCRSLAPLLLPPVPRGSLCPVMSRRAPETARTPLANNEHTPPRRPGLLRMASSVHTSEIARGERVEGDEHDPGPDKYEPYFKRAPQPLPHESAWKHSLHALLCHPITHRVVLVLILLDLLVVMAEIFIDLFSFQDCRSHVGLEKYEEAHAAHTASEALRIVSLVILASFLVENGMRLVVMGASFYLKHWLHLFDIAVVATSFLVTIFLHGALEEVVALFIFLRLWRVLRIVDGVAMTLEEKSEKHKHKKNELIKQLKAHIVDMESSSGGGNGNGKRSPAPPTAPASPAAAAAAGSSIQMGSTPSRPVQPLLTSNGNDEQQVTFTMADDDDDED